MQEPTSHYVRKEGHPSPHRPHHEGQSWSPAHIQVL
uniref:Uncharacterized protein n=1 Tax=Rhizophora mucronata TaxID=61149 RepID=A0A2P2QYV7_RHIMU